MLSFGGGTPVAPTFSGNEVRTQVTAGTDFPLLAKKYENELIFSAGAPRRPGTPLLQFWHHEVTDCSAKTSVPKEEEPNQNLKGFQRDWWDPAPSVFYCIYNLFPTFAKKCFLWRHEELP